jgi:hypothetical protein
MAADDLSSPFSGIGTMPVFATASLSKLSYSVTPITGCAHRDRLACSATASTSTRW